MNNIASTRLAGLAGISLFSAFQPVVAETAWQDEPIVVTANRTEQSAADVPARVSVITRADIERSQAPDLVELLRLEAGIDIARNGGPGGQTSVFMRGANSNHVLVLIDGVRASASGTGAFTWEILDPAVIDRIEIVRGPRAARWGSDAIGGVIQIFTRRAEGVSAGLRYGSDNDRKATLAAGRQQGDLPLDLTLTARKVGGFSAQNPRGFGFNPDDDGFENLSAATGGSAGLGGGSLSWRGRIASGETEFDQGVSDYDNWSWRFDYVGASTGPWQWRIGAATLRDRLETERLSEPMKSSLAACRATCWPNAAGRTPSGWWAWMPGANRASARVSGMNRAPTWACSPGLEGTAGATRLRTQRFGWTTMRNSAPSSPAAPD